VAAGKPKMLALIAVARKLLTILTPSEVGIIYDELPEGIQSLASTGSPTLSEILHQAGAHPWRGPC
jgi:hypothetical protein